MKKIIWFLRYKARLIVFCILGHFLPFNTLNNPKNQNLEKNENKTWRYDLFTLVYHKWQSCDVWFPRYGTQQTEVFVILNYFLPFNSPPPSPPHNLKNQYFEKMKKMPGYIIILDKCTMNENHDVWFLGYGVEQNFLSLWTSFCSFMLLTNNQDN